MAKFSHILITGCSSGIGYHCAHMLHQRGYRVVASCRAQHDVERLAAEGLTCIQLDLNDSVSIESGFAKALTLLGHRLDGLFNNAGFGQTGAIEDLSTDALRHQFETNFFGLHHLTRLVLKQMLSQQCGRIINNSSVLALAALRYRGAYCASKFALEGYTDTLRLELAGTPIKISLIETGPINTLFRQNAKQHMLNNIDYKNSRHRLNYQTTLTRLGHPIPQNPYTLEPEAVGRCVLHALESTRPKSRYYVTRASKIVALAKRFLPTRMLDRFSYKGGA